MSRALAHTSEHQNENGDMIVSPSHLRPIGVAAEQQRAIAEVQAALAIAKGSPRNEIACVDRIANACQRVGVAEVAEYSFSRGGTEISGPSIDLMTVIANAWGNIQFGFRELMQTQGESTVEAFAWDLETNSKRILVFQVPHKRVTKKGTFPLTDPTDIYLHVANMAQRRVRSCLEAIIPPDVVENAREQCHKTLKEKADVTPESLAKLVAAFAKLGITKEQIEERIQRRIDTMQPAQLVNLRRIYKSIQDGMSVSEDWFKLSDTTPEASKTATDAAKEALKSKMAKPAEEPSKPTTEPESAVDATATEQEAKPDLDPRDKWCGEFKERVAALTTAVQCDAALNEAMVESEYIGEFRLKDLLAVLDAKRKTLKAKK